MSERARSTVLPERTEAGDVLTDLVLTVFRANGLFLEAASDLAAPAGLTAARWQVLGAVLDAPRTVAGVARAMGLSRQGVQRLADALVAEGLAAYAPNPAHRRAKLLAPTPAGRAAVRRIGSRQHSWANDVSADLAAAGVSAGALRACVETLRATAARVEAGLTETGLTEAGLETPEFVP